VGCRSDRECTLAPSLSELGLSGVDPRLLKCTTQGGVGKCILPCQNDAQCPVTEVCSGGICEYIGCKGAAECKTILGVVDQEADPERPWVPRLECRAP
jgi:hypothetical protein